MGYWVGKTYYNPRTGKQRSVWRYVVGRARRRHNQPRQQRHQAQHTGQQTRQRTTPAASTMPVAALVIGGLLLGGWMLWHNPATQQILQALFGSMMK